MNNQYTIEKVWSHKGLPCVVIMNNMGFRCGYVGVDEKHPLFKAYYMNDCPALNGEAPASHFNVHGGLTYSGGSDDYPVTTTEPTWWFGYDCGHSMDAPVPGSKLADHWLPGIHRSLKYCVGVCESLADQLKEVADGRADKEE